MVVEISVELLGFATVQEIVDVDTSPEKQAQLALMHWDPYLLVSQEEVGGKAFHPSHPLEEASCWQELPA